MVDGDFKKFEGKWSVKCGTRYDLCSIFGCLDGVNDSSIFHALVLEMLDLECSCYYAFVY